MPEYYYEYIQPITEDYDPENSNPTDINQYSILSSGVIYAQDEHRANLVIKDQISNVFEEYKKYNYGVIMFTENDNVVEFTESDWKSRLKRETVSPDNIIRFNLTEE